MNTLLRRFFILAAVLLCCTALANAANPDAIEIGGIYYILDHDNGTATVTWSGERKEHPTEEYSGDIVIPEKFTDHNIEYTVTSIGENAFWDCNRLESITIPSSVTSIERWAFSFCVRLKSIYVSWETPLAISDFVFSGLSTSEITLHVPDGTLDAYSTAYVWETFDLDGIISFADANAEVISVENWDTDHDNLLSTEEAAAVTNLGDAFSNSTITSFNELKYFTGLKSIGESAFQGTAITSIEIPTTITSIGNNAFKDCGNLKFVSIPATVTSIGESAFKNCTGIEEIYVKNQSPLSISSNVFENVATTCLLRVPYDRVTSYQKADVWKDFTNIQDNAIQFKDPAVKEICLANWDTNKDGVLTYEEAATVKIIDDFIDSEFSNHSNITSFDELKYFTGLKVIGEWAFSGCTNLASITIPNSVTTIGSDAFKGCTSLTAVTIPNSVTDIGRSAFEGCKGLTSITIPSSVTDIGRSAFEGCTGLTSVTIPNSVTDIGERAFSDCTNLASITIPNSVTDIGERAFSDCTNLASITIPNSVTSIGERAFNGCNQLKNVNINVIDFANDNIIYDYFYSDKTIKYYYNGEEISGELTIPSTTTAIGNNALKSATGLASITIPSSVTNIGNSAFEGCTGLETVSVQWTEAEKIPNISEKNVFNGITLSDVTLNIPYINGNIRSPYTAKNVWKDFNIVFAKNFIITKSDNTTIEHKASENSEIAIDETEIAKLLVIDDVPNVKSITYTRDFTNVAGKWQAWFVPFEAPVSVLNEASIDVAEIAGILLNSEGETIVAFKKIEGDSKKMHANTPYVVRMGNDATTIATLVFENTNLKETAESEYYAMSMYDKFTFTGNYESKHVADSYTLNKDGEFQQMDENVNLKPMRFSLAVTPRDDSPYGNDPAGQAPKSAIRYMVLGDDSTLQPIDDEDGRTGIKPATTPANSFKRSQQPMRIYDMHGRKVNRIQSKQVYIIDGKTYTAR